MPSADHVFGSMQHFRRAVQAVLDEEDALVLQARVPAEEEVRSFAQRRRVLLVVVQLQHARLELGAQRDRSRYGNVTLFCASTHAAVSSEVSSSSQRYGSGTDAVVDVDVIAFASLRIAPSPGSRRRQRVQHEETEGNGDEQRPVASREARASSRERRNSKHVRTYQVLRVLPLSRCHSRRSAGERKVCWSTAPRQPSCVFVRLRASVVNPLPPSTGLVPALSRTATGTNPAPRNR